MTSKLLAAAGAVATGLTAVVAVSTVAAAPAHAAGCPSSYSHVQGADWLRVHTRPGTSTSVVGQLSNGTLFCYITNSAGEIQGASANGYYWEYGYGYNGSTRLTGWVDAEYLAHP